jgi:hypothetical protein
MRTTKLLLRIVLVLSILSSFTFGATELLAASPAETCFNDGHNTLGECVSPENCNERCQAIGGVFGDCPGPGVCCFCEF